MGSVDFLSGLSIVADIMSVLGISAVFILGLVQKSLKDLSNLSVSMLAVFFKLSLCFVALVLLFGFMFYLHGIILVIFKGSLHGGQILWDSNESFIYILTYLIDIIVWSPIYLTICACIFTWSVKPYNRLLSSIKKG